MSHFGTSRYPPLTARPEFEPVRSQELWVTSLAEGFLLDTGITPLPKWSHVENITQFMARNLANVTRNVLNHFYSLSKLSTRPRGALKINTSISRIIFAFLLTIYRLKRFPGSCFAASKGLGSSPCCFCCSCCSF